MAAKTFNISLDQELVERIDQQAKRDYSSRSDFIRRAVVNQLNTEQALEAVLNRANAKGQKMGIESEEQVYAILRGAENEKQ